MSEQIFAGNLQLRHLNCLLVLSREHHFGRAAKALSVSQPALSQTLRQIERQFGFPIFERQQSGIKGVTQEGQKVLSWARQTLAELKHLVQSSNAEEQLTGTLRIGVAPVAMSIISLLTTAFNERHPKVLISIFSRNLKDVERDLRSFDLDIGVNYLEAITQVGLRPYHLYTEAYYLLVPDGHDLADRTSVSWYEVGQLPLCMLSSELHYRVILNRVFSEVGAAPQAIIETDCSLGLFAHTRSGRWLSVVPHSFLYLLENWTLIRSIPICEPVVANTIGIVVLERSPLSPLVNAFIESAQDANLQGTLDRHLKIPGRSLSLHKGMGI